MAREWRRRTRKSKCKVGRRKAVVLFDMTTGNCDMERKGGGGGLSINDCCRTDTQFTRSHAHIELPRSSGWNATLSDQLLPLHICFSPPPSPYNIKHNFNWPQIDERINKTWNIYKVEVIKSENQSIKHHARSSNEQPNTSCQKR